MKIKLIYFVYDCNVVWWHNCTDKMLSNYTMLIKQCIFCIIILCIIGWSWIHYVLLCNYDNIIVFSCTLWTVWPQEASKTVTVSGDTLSVTVTVSGATVYCFWTHKHNTFHYTITLFWSYVQISLFVSLASIFTSNNTIIMQYYLVCIKK